MKHSIPWCAVFLGLFCAATPARAASACEAELPDYRRNIKLDVDEACRQALWADFPAFGKTVCPTIPEDVDTTRYAALIPGLASGALPQLNRLFDLFAWRTFTALSWPVDDKELPKESIAGAGTPWFLKWKTASDVFPTSDGVYESSELDVRSGDTNQPDKHDLVDQNGNTVTFEILINEPVVNYITKNTLFSMAGQEKFFQCVRKERGADSDATPLGADLPWGSDSPAGRRKVGATIVKVAWKVLDPAKGDKPERYIRRTLKIDKQVKQVGLVGMNIMRKTFRTKARWTWIVFEHVDNLQTNDLETQVKPSFYDPQCPTCPVNVPPVLGGPRKPTQVMRMVPIPPATAALNAEVQALFRSAFPGSPLQYYELVGSQWPTAPAVEPSGAHQLPDALTNQSGGRPNMAYLVNTMIETYLQVGNQSAASLNVGRLGDPSHVFATSSCMGCHFSAPMIAESYPRRDNQNRSTRVPLFGGPRSADFLFMLSRRAR